MTGQAPGRLVREPVVELETAARTAVPLAKHPLWSECFPWLVQGTTTRGSGTPFDMGLAGRQEVSAALARWWALRDALGMGGTVLARQVHGRDIFTHETHAPGIHLAPHADGHLTRARALLLTVTVADCVPVFLVAEQPRVVVLLHAGWRGVAAGILEAALERLRTCGVEPSAVHAHFGPSICGECYEVGPEVHAALGLPEPPDRRPVDLRAALARRSVAAGVPEASITRSEWCTRCGERHFFSHRAGDAGRQVGVLGIRAD